MAATLPPPAATTGVFSVIAYGAKGDGSTNDYAAFAAALQAIYAAKGGTLLVPRMTAGYVLGSSVVIDVGQYSGGSGITIELNGNPILPSHAGWCFDISTNFFGANNGGILGKKLVIVRGGGATITTSNGAAAGGLRLNDTVGVQISDLTINSYAAGDALQLRITSNDLSTWNEHGEFVRIRGSGNLTGVHHKSSNVIGSFLGNVYRSCTFEGKVNNAKLFNLEGLIFDGLFENCGGYYNQLSTTGGCGFYLNGGYTGTTFINPWIDVGNTGTQSPLTDFVFGPNYTATLTYYPTIINPTEINLPPTWRTQMFVTGALNFGTLNAAAPANPREVLRSPRTYYVSTTGSDTDTSTLTASNAVPGLTQATAFATIAKAVSVIYQTLDCGSQTVTIQLADGTYSEKAVFSGQPLGLGTASIILAGNTATPGNVVISTTSQDAVALTAGARVTVQGIKIQTTTSGNGISIDAGSALSVGAGMQFGACAQRHVQVTGGSTYTISAAYTLTGDSPVHLNIAARSLASHTSGAVDATNRAFSGHFIECHENSVFNKTGGSYVTTGSTGGRWWVYGGGVIQTFGGGATLFPGANAGVTDAATYGVYA